jgi:DNA-binding response OmpR family regulator
MHRVLLVEDHVDSAETLALVLSLKGYEVKVARTVKDAQRLAEGCDVMISDISLPDGSGLDLVHEVQQRLPLRAIALSGYGTEEDQRRSLDAGFAEHLTKPVDVDKLLAAVGRLAGSPAPLSR